MHISLASRTTLWKSAFCSILLYTMQTTSLPKGSCEDIERICRRLIWGSSNNQRKTSLMAWEKLCHLKKHGGLGIHNMALMNKIFMMKLGRGLISNQNALWVRLMRAKYGPVSHMPPPNLVTRNGSHVWRSMGKVWS
ncbi:hypothetical protein Scep_022224 [Stephania cephalantha]|uniref:Uncharacterized protein n=1 Tax=Stephania cephalantha TaxID=152367 RepID=A0AAP0F7J3_9MAGN